MKHRPNYTRTLKQEDIFTPFVQTDAEKQNPGIDF